MVEKNVAMPGLLHCTRPRSATEHSLTLWYALRDRHRTWQGAKVRNFPNMACMHMCAVMRAWATTTATQTRPQRRGWPRHDHGPPPARLLPTGRRLAATRCACSAPPVVPSGGSGLGASTDRQRAADDRLDVLDHSTDVAGADGHACKQIARRKSVSSARSHGRWCGMCVCPRAGSARAEAGKAVDSAPGPRSVMPICTRHSSLCHQPPLRAP